MMEGNVPCRVVCEWMVIVERYIRKMVQVFKSSIGLLTDTPTLTNEPEASATVTPVPANQIEARLVTHARLLLTLVDVWQPPAKQTSKQVSDIFKQCII